MKEPCSVTFVMAKINVTRYTLNLGDNIRKKWYWCVPNLMLFLQYKYFNFNDMKRTYISVHMMMSDKGAFIPGVDFLMDGGAIASYFYGPLHVSSI